MHRSAIIVSIFVLLQIICTYAKEGCSYHFVVPDSDGISCTVPEVAKINNELTNARERTNSVASTLSREVSKIQNLAASLQTGIGQLSKELNVVKADVDGIGNVQAAMKKFENSLQNMNWTLNSDYKYLQNKIIDVANTDKTQFNNQMILLSRIMGENTRLRKQLSDLETRLQVIFTMPDKIQTIDNTLNDERSENAITNSKIKELTQDFERRKQADDAHLQTLDARVSNVSSNIQSLSKESSQMVSWSDKMESKVNDLSDNVHEVMRTLVNHSAILNMVNPVSITTKIEALENVQSKNSQMLNNVEEKLLNGNTDVGLAEKLKKMESEMKQEQELSNAETEGIRTRLTSLGVKLDMITRDVASLKRGS